MTQRRFVVEEMPDGAPYRMLTGVVVPRPIAWVSSLDREGRRNLAPHSFFTVASGDPPIVLFTSMGRKDSLRNIEATGEFVVNLVPRRLLDQMNASAASVPGDVDEFDLVGLETTESTYVAPPRVSAAPAAMECRLVKVDPVGDGFLVLGEVLAFWVDEEALDGDRPQEWVLDPIGRASGSRYITYGETVSLRRPK